MNNPAPVVDQETPEQSLLSDELMTDLHEGKKTISDLDEAQKDALHDHLMGEKDSSTETIEEMPAENPAEKSEKETAPKGDESASEDTVKTAQQSKTDDKAEYKKIKDEENKWKQKVNSAKKRRAKYEEEFKALDAKEVKIESDEDPYDEENFKKFVKESRTNQARQNDKIDFLLKKLKSRDVEDETYAGEQLSKTQDNGIFASINDLQDDYPVLNTKTPFKKMNNQWAGFLDTLVKAAELKADNMDFTDTERQNPAVMQQKMRQVALDMYDDNPMFKERTEKYFPKAFADEKEKDKYEFILGLHDKSRNAGGSMRANYLEHLDENGLLEEAIGTARREGEIKGSRKAATAIKTETISTLSPSDGPGTNPSADSEMTLARAQQIVPYIKGKQLRGEKVTKSDMKLQDAAIKVLEETMGLNK